jgi:hypothetical protein
MAGPVENLRTFDYTGAQLIWSDQRWQLLVGGAVLKDFGRRQAEASQALRLIRDLHLTQYGTVGSPHPVMEYWLAEGQAPRGLTWGLRSLPLDLGSLRAEPIQSQWCLRDNQRIIFNFGQRADDARQALTVIRKYDFSRVVVVGQAAPEMLVFLADPGVHSSSGTTLTPSRVHPTSHHSDAAVQTSNQAAQDLRTRYPGAGLDTIVTPALSSLQQPSSAAQQPLTAFGRRAEESFPTRSQPGVTDMSVTASKLACADRVPFDWRQVQLTLDNGNWKLVTGGRVLADFGPDEHDARLALSAVKHYRFSEQCLVGGPSDPFSFFLCNGQAPHGLMFGLNGLSFQPESVAVCQVGPEWALSAGSQVLLRFGDRPDEARQMLAAIQRYRFDRLCHLGSPEAEGLTLFVRTH